MTRQNQVSNTKKINKQCPCLPMPHLPIIGGVAKTRNRSKKRNHNPENHINSPEGWVYIISDGLYAKIGKTENTVENRVKQLQTGNPNQLKIIYKIKCHKGLKANLETSLHNLFKEKNLHERDEWFKLRILDYIDWAINGDINEIRNENDIYKFIELVSNSIQ